jgi:hypothetical protein
VLDEGADLPFEISGQVVVVEQDAVLQGLVPVAPALYPARISASSSLLAATMNQKSALREDTQFVSGC